MILRLPLVDTVVLAAYVIPFSIGFTIFVEPTWPVVKMTIEPLVGGPNLFGLFLIYGDCTLVRVELGDTRSFTGVEREDGVVNRIEDNLVLLVDLFNKPSEVGRERELYDLITLSTHFDAPLGFEPRSLGPKPSGLPLADGAMVRDSA